jgi:hypothetical protein
MGIHSDTYEDSIERYGQFIQNQPSSSFYAGPKFQEPPRYLRCDECQKRIAFRDFDSHLQGHHATRHVYIICDGVILPDISFTDRLPLNIRVKLVGTNQAQLILTINGEIIEKTITSTDYNLLGELKNISEGEIGVRLKLNSFEKAYQIYFGKQPRFSNRHIDQNAYTHLFLPLDLNMPLDVDQYRSVINYYGLSSLEQRYAGALIDYAIAFLNLKANQNAKDLLERSFNDIRVFVTPFARDMAKILALNMNCFNYFEDSHIDSYFYPVDVFFCGITYDTRRRRFFDDTRKAKDTGVIMLPMKFRPA